MTFCMNVSRFMNLAAIFSLDLESQYKQLTHFEFCHKGYGTRGLETSWIIVVRQGYHRVFLGSGSSRPRHLHPLSSLGGYCIPRAVQGAVL